MNISGIRPSTGFYSYNSISDIGGISQQEEAARASEASIDEESRSKAPSVSQKDIDMARSRQTYGSADYAGEYRPGETYEMKGAQSDLRTLDIEKAISDMQKDQMLSQYQYFVGETSGAQSGAVRGAEDFSL